MVLSLSNYVMLIILFYNISKHKINKIRYIYEIEMNSNNERKGKKKLVSITENNHKEIETELSVIEYNSNVIYTLPYS